MVKRTTNKSIVNSISAICTFALSALLHEFMAWAMLTETIPFEQSLFFLSHGLMTILEVLVSKCNTGLGRKIESWIGKESKDSIFRITSIIIAWTFFLWTSSIFLGSFERDTIIWRLSKPFYLPNVWGFVFDNIRL